MALARCTYVLLVQLVLISLKSSMAFVGSGCVLKVQGVKSSPIHLGQTIGHFNEDQSGSVKNKTTRQETRQGAAAERPRLPSCPVVLFFTIWPSLKYVLF